MPIREREWYFHDSLQRTVYHELLPPEDDHLDLSEIVSFYMLLWAEIHFVPLTSSDLASAPLAGMG